MKSIAGLTKQELIELENRCWMTHDGMWFFVCLSNFGIERANKLNKAAIRGLAPFEVGRTKKAVGFEKEKVENFLEFEHYFAAARTLFIPPFMKGSVSFPRENVMRWEFEPGQCFAYKGIKRMGAIDQYECGVMYRIECWLECLGVRYEMTPKVDKCLMQLTGYCSGEIELDFS
ncbi:MAG TPA: DUF6125 family protein [Smithellaceae bacterium]|nr:DUF6125 family protein [Smithellaceae bacterium]